MTDQEITAIAREYAEEEAKGTAVESLPDGFKEYVIQRNANQFEKHLRWLLRRYCLVEKEGVYKWTGVKLRLPEIDQRVLICERVANQYKIFIGRRIALSNGGWEWNQSIKESVVAWMPLPKYSPEITKEVEE